MSSRRSTLALALVAVCCLAALPPGIAAAAVPDARLSISAVGVSPDTPVTDAPVTVDVTVANAAGSSDAVSLDSVAIVDPVTGETLVSARDTTSLSVGGSTTIPLTTRFRTPGVKRLQVVAVGTDEDGDSVTTRRPLTVVVEQAPPLLELRPGDPVAGTRSTTEVVVSNPTTAAMRNLVVTLDLADGRVTTARRTVASLAAGGNTTLSFEAVPGAAGSTTVAAQVAYTTSRGTRATTVRERTVRVAQLDDDVGVRVAPATTDETAQASGDLGGQLGSLIGGVSGGGGATQQDDADEPTRRVEVTVTNFGNAPIADVVVTPRTDEVTLPRVAVAGPIAPGETGSAVVRLDALATSAAVTFDVGYDVGDDRSRATGAFDYRPETGAIRLTGVDLTREDGVVRVSGNAGNTGPGAVSGLVLTVRSGPGVDPAYPQRDYFVGTVEGNEFAPFDLTARVDPDDAETVPVTVRYVVNGVERTETVRLPVGDALDADERRSGSGLPFGSWTLLFVVVGIVGVAALALGVRRYR